MEPTDDLAMPFLLMAAFRGLVDAVHEQLAAAGYPGFRATHGFAMQAIGAGCTSVELGHRLGVSKQAATRTARTLEELGLIRRIPNDHDRRELVLTPTRHAERVLQLSAELFRSELRGWRHRVGDEYVDATLTTLAAASAGRRGPTDLSDWV